MLKSIKKYLNKAKEEISKEYDVGPEEIVVIDSEKKVLPKIWTGVDLDGTLAVLDRNASYDEVGEPVPAMMALVRKMINNGIRVKIFTARPRTRNRFPSSGNG